jgi:hypothetical protein
MYAACLEAMNSASGVQVIQEKATALPALGRIDFRWVTQREYPFQGFRVFRAPDVANAPGTFTQLNPGLVAPTGDPNIQGDDNRQNYLYQDNDPTLTVGQQYWYKVEWVDLASVAHTMPPVPVAYGTLARVATAFYSIAHNAVDNDLLVRVGASLDYDPGNLGDAELEVLGPGESGQDSAHVILPPTIPANTGTSTAGTIDHFWSVGFRQGDGVEWWLPPGQGNAWFLKVVDGGFVNRNGRVTSFSLFVNDSPGSASGTTYTTNHSPMPAPLIEGGVVATTLWIPEQDVLSASVARFRAEILRAKPSLVLELTQEAPGATAQVYRNTSDDFATRELLTPEALPITGTRFEFLDASAKAGVTYSYWVAFRESSGRTIMNGPVTITALPEEAVAFTRPPYPNPVAGTAVFEYAVGAEAAAENEPLTIAIHDLQGRVVRTLARNLKREPGVYHATWDATDDHGRQVANGRYYLRLSAGRVTRTTTLTVVR